MARDDPKFIVRLPPVLKARIEEVSRATGRSMNAEIVARLEDSLSVVPQLRERAEALQQQVAVLSHEVHLRQQHAPAGQPHGRIIHRDNLREALREVLAEQPLIARHPVEEKIRARAIEMGRSPEEAVRLAVEVGEAMQQREIEAAIATLERVTTTPHSSRAAAEAPAPSDRPPHSARTVVADPAAGTGKRILDLGPDARPTRPRPAKKGS